MKANYNRDKWTAKLDNEAIKAIRFVNGFNTDLRVKLMTINKSALFDWIQDNEVGIFGMDISPRPDSTDDAWDRYEGMLWRVVDQICGTNI